MLSLKSAARSINKLFLFKNFEIDCASPFGNAVNIISTSNKYSFLNFEIFGNLYFFKSSS